MKINAIFIILFYFGLSYASAASLIDVKDAAYGATGNGSDDDTTAILSAIAASDDGDTVYFPPGIYKLSTMGEVFIHKSINLIGENAVLDGVQAGSSDASFVLGDNLSNIKIQGLHFTNFSTAIAVQNTTYSYSDIQILNNKFSYCENGINLSAEVKRVIISQNIFTDIESDSRAYTAAIRVGKGSVSDDPELENSKKVIISDNIIKNVIGSPTGVTAYGIQAIARDLVITGNIIDSVKILNQNAKADGLYVKAYSTAVSNNHFRDAGSSNYIKLKSNFSETTTGGYLGDYIISNNTFRTDLITASDHIISIYSDDVDISDNLFTHCKANRSVIEADAHTIERIRIRDNTFKNCDVPNHIVVESSNHEITGNSFFSMIGNDSNSTTSVVKIYTGQYVNPLKNTTVASNRFYFDSKLNSTSKAHYGIEISASGEDIDGMFIQANEFFGYNWQTIGNNPAIIRPLNFYSSGGTHKNYRVSDNTFYGEWRDVTHYLRIDFELDSAGIAIIDNKPAGGVVNLTASTALHKGESGVTIMNEGATNIVTMTLPSAERGLVFRGTNVSNHDLRFDPVSNQEVLGGNGNGKYIALKTGASVELKCLASGKWSIISESGDIEYEL